MINLRITYTIRIVIVAALVASALFLAGYDSVHAAFNKQINYQGKLTTLSNVAVADGLYTMQFKLYSSATGGSPLWTETLTGQVQVTSGLFSVMLGSTTPLTSVDFNQTLYLGVTVASDTEMLPRKILGAVPAAFVADTVDGISSEQFLRSEIQNATSSSSTFLNILQSGAGKIAEFFGAASKSVLSLLSNGNVGVGSTTPGSKFSIHANNGETNSLLFTVASSTGNSTTTLFSISNSGNVGINTSSVLSNAALQVGSTTNSAYWMVDKNTGYMGFATSTPSFPLSISNANQNTYFSVDTTQNNAVINFGGTANTQFNMNNNNSAGTNAFNFQRSGVNIASFGINNSGGYFTGGNSATLQISVANSATLAFSAGGNSAITYSNNSREVMRIGSLNSMVGIGMTPNDNAMLDVSAPSWLSPRTTEFFTIEAANTATSTTNSINKGGLQISSTGAWTGTGAKNIGLNITSVSGGTENYDALFNGGNNVGIGTTSPPAKLTVVGDGYFSGNLTGANVVATGTLSVLGKTTLANSSSTNETISSNLYLPSITSAYLAADLTGKVIATTSPVSSQWTTSGSNIFYNTGNVGIGTTTPGSKLSIHDSSGLSGTNPLFTIASSTLAGLSTTTLFTVLGNGRVGIGGTPTAGTNLEVRADNQAAAQTIGLSLRNNTLASAGVQQPSPVLSLVGQGWETLDPANIEVAFNQYVLPVQGTVLPSANLFFQSRVLGTTVDRMVLTSSGILGIGTSTPASIYKLAVIGGAYFAGNVVATGTLTVSGQTILANASTTNETISGNFYLPSITSSFLATDLTGKLIATTSPVSSQWTTSGSNIFYNTGNVGIGSSTPGAKLSVTGDTFLGGNVTATGTLSIGTSSPATLANDGAGALTIAAAGTNQNLILTPSGTGTVNLGSGSNGTLQAGGVKFSGGARLTSNSNELYLDYGGANQWTGLRLGSVSFSNSAPRIISVDNNTLEIDNGVTGTFRDLVVRNLSMGTTSTSTTLTLQGQPGVNPLSVASSTGANLLSLNANGFLGIGGTSTPSSALTVIGSDVLINPSSGTASLTFRQGASSNWWQINNSSSFNFTNVNSGTTPLSLTSSGVTATNLTVGSLLSSPTNVVINTQQYSGTASFTFANPSNSTSGKITYFTNDGTDPTQDYMAFNVKGAEALRISSAGNLGIGTTSPSNKLEVSGNTFLGGNVTATGTLIVSGQTTLGNASTTNATVSTNLYLPSITSSFLATDLTGKVIATTTPGGGSQWTTNGSNIFYNTGNVGIGSSTPGVKLSVTGNSFFGGNVTATGTLAVSGQTTLGNASTSQLSVSSLTDGRVTFAGTGGLLTDYSDIYKSGGSLVSQQGFSVFSDYKLKLDGDGDGFGFILNDASDNYGYGINNVVFASPSSQFTFIGGEENNLGSLLAADMHLTGQLVVDSPLTANFNITNNGTYTDGVGESGGSSDVLTSTGSATEWIPQSSLTPNVSIATGVLANANGGTGLSSSLTAGSIVFSNGTTFAQDNANLFWDNTNKRLGLGTTSPVAKLSVGGNAYIGGNITATGTLAISGQTTLANASSSIQTISTDLYLSSLGSTYLAVNQLGKVIATTTPISSQWTTSGANISYTAGNVGIGTSSPTNALSVTGNGYFSGSLTAGNTIATGTLSVLGKTTLAAASSTYLTVTGNLNVASPSFTQTNGISPFQVVNSSGAQVLGLYNATGIDSTFSASLSAIGNYRESSVVNYGGEFAFWAKSSYTANVSAMVRAFNIDSGSPTNNGFGSLNFITKDKNAQTYDVALKATSLGTVINAGWGATPFSAEPGAALEVNKVSTNATHLRLNYDASNYVTYSVGSTGLETIDANGTGAGFNFLDNIGVSSSTPSAKLSIHSFGGSNTVPILAVASSTSNGLATTTLFNVFGNGNVGISTTSPAYKLSVNGTVGFSNLSLSTTGNYLCIDTVTNQVTSGTTCTLSSGRFKQNVQNLNLGLNTVLALRPVTFNFKQGYGDNGATDQLGFVAEEANSIDPRLVPHDENGLPSGFNYSNYTAVLTKAIQEQQIQINSLKNASPTSTTITAIPTKDYDAPIAGLTDSVAKLTATVANLDFTASTSKALASSTSFITTIADTVRDIISSTGEWVVSKITATVAFFKDLTAEKLTVGSKEKRTGITLYDEANGNPYCFKVVNGTMSTIVGECGIVDTTTPTTTDTNTIASAPIINATSSDQITTNTGTTTVTTIAGDNGTVTSTSTAPVQGTAIVSNPSQNPETAPTQTPTVPPVPESTPAPQTEVQPAPAPEPTLTPAPVSAPEPAPAPAPVSVDNPQ